MVTVSVIIPVFNGGATVRGAIESTLAQGYDGYEIIVVDDGSTDDTADVIGSYASRVRLVRQSNLGPSAARNAGCRVAQGQYLAFLDADDRWRPDKLRLSIPVLQSDENTVLVYSDAVPVDASGDAQAESYVGKLGRAPSMEDLLTRWWPILPSAAVMRRDAFEACGGFAEEFRSAAYEDPLLWLMMREQGPFGYLPDRLVYYTSAPVGRRMEKYRLAQRTFMRLVQERYGDSARLLLRSTRHAYASAMSHEGLVALRRGDRTKARQYFVKAWIDQPMRIRLALRLLRSFLPLALALKLSGNSTTKKPLQQGAPNPTAGV